MARVLDVAAYVLGKQGAMTTMKLQKLCYYSQGWSLAWDGVPLFDEPIEAWANGPVVYDLFQAHRGKFHVDRADIAGDPGALTEAQRETIDAVLEGYGHLSGKQLSELTHSERPWVEARGQLGPGDRSREEIDPAAMQDFFGGLAGAE